MSVLLEAVVHLEFAHLLWDVAGALIVPELSTADRLEHVPPYLFLGIDSVLRLPVLSVHIVCLTVQVFKAPYK